MSHDLLVQMTYSHIILLSNLKRGNKMKNKIKQIKK